MNNVKVLFICIHNSARSQMAEAYLKELGGEKFAVESAGLEAGTLNPLAIEVMKEDGIDISKNQTNDVFEFFKQSRLYHYVIAVCDEASAARCPIFPGVHQRINWSFADPSSFAGTHEEQLAATRIVRNEIKAAVQNFIEQLSRHEHE
jgi:arsenate reductase